MYNFDEVIDRSHTNALNTDGFRQYIFNADETMNFPYRDEEFIRMWVADMEFATPDVILSAIQERLERRILGYTRVYEPSYFNAFANWCKHHYDWSFEKKELVMSNGIIPALFELVKYICQPDEKVLFLTPSYAYFKHAADRNGNQTVHSELRYQEGEYHIDFDDLARKAADPKTTLLIFCNPHNPTGRVWTEQELHSLAEIIRQHQLWVISDEIHCDLLRTGVKHTPFGKIMPDYDHLITAMAPSKTFNIAGMMISNVLIRNEALRQTWLANHYNFDNPLSIAAAQAAYEKGQPWLTELKVYLDKNFAFVEQFLNQHLPKAHFHIPQATYLAWIDLRAYFPPDTDLIAFFAHNAGILLEDGKRFVSNADGFIRLNLACPKATVEEGLKRIVSAIKKEGIA